MTLPSKIRRRPIIQLAERGLRVDGRKFDEYREISIETGIINRAEGSAKVSIGHTQVLVGVKAEIGEPFPDTPDKGVLIVNAELVPLASPTFEPGPPDENAIELARIVDRGLRESEAIPFEELCIIPSKKVWMLFVDIYVMDHDGNFIDASAIGALAALMTTELPKVEIGNNDEVTIIEEEKKLLELRDMPIAVTFAKIGKHLLIDPCLDEEDTMDARLTITMTKDDNICAVQKGKGELTIEDLYTAIDICKIKSKKIRKKVEDACKKN